MAVFIVQVNGGLNRLRNFAGQACQHALPGALAQGHSLKGGLGHVFGPAKGTCLQSLVERRRRQRQSQRHGQRVSGWQLGTALQLGVAGLLQVAQPVKQGATHLLGLQAHFGGFSGGHDPVVQGLQALSVHVLPSRNGLRQHGHITA